MSEHRHTSFHERDACPECMATIRAARTPRAEDREGVLRALLLDFLDNYELGSNVDARIREALASEDRSRVECQRSDAQASWCLVHDALFPPQAIRCNGVEDRSRAEDREGVLRGLMRSALDWLDHGDVAAATFDLRAALASEGRSRVEGLDIAVWNQGDPIPHQHPGSTDACFCDESLSEWETRQQADMDREASERQVEGLDDLYMAVCDATAVDERIYFDDDKLEHGQAIVANLREAGYEVRALAKVEPLPGEDGSGIA